MFVRGLISNGVPLADGFIFMVVGYPMEGSVHTLKDAAPRGQSGLGTVGGGMFEDVHELSYVR